MSPSPVCDVQVIRKVTSRNTRSIVPSSKERKHTPKSLQGSVLRPEDGGTRVRGERKEEAFIYNFNQFL